MKSSKQKKRPYREISPLHQEKPTKKLKGKRVSNPIHVMSHEESKEEQQTEKSIDLEADNSSLPTLSSSSLQKLIVHPDVISKDSQYLNLKTIEPLKLLDPDDDPYLTFSHNINLNQACRREICDTFLSFQRSPKIQDCDAVKILPQVRQADLNLNAIVGNFRFLSNILLFLQRLQRTTQLPALAALTHGTLLGDVFVAYDNVVTVLHLYR